MVKISNFWVSPFDISFSCFVTSAQNQYFRMTLDRKDLELKNISTEPSIYSRLAHGIVVRAIEKYGINHLPDELYGAWG